MKRKSRLVARPDVENSSLLISSMNALMVRLDKDLINFALIISLKKTTKLPLGVQLQDVPLSSLMKEA